MADFARDGNEQDGPSIVLQDSSELAHSLTILKNVLQDMATEDDVEGPIRVLDIGNVHRHHGGGIGKVCRQVSLAEFLA